jgi:hypothetical protein
LRGEFSAVIARESGQSSNTDALIDKETKRTGTNYWMPRLRRA